MSEGTETEKLTERQQRVLDAALAVFAEKGFAGASTSEIAKRAGVAEGTVFKTYKTKKELLIAVVAPLFARFVAPTLIDDVLAIIRHQHPTFEAFLRELFLNRLEFIRGHERAFRIAVQELPFHDDVRELAKKTLAARVLPDVVALIQRFQASGELRTGDPTSILRIAAGTFLMYAVTRNVLVPEKAWDDAAELELMIQTLASGLKPS